MPLGQRADGPPSRRVTEPTSRRARKRQEFEPPSSAPTPRTAQDAPRECEVRTAPCPGFRLLSSPTHSHAWPFAVARATQVCRRNHNQSGTVWRAIALARSDHPAATGESDPSVTLPRTSPPAIVWYQQAPIQWWRNAKIGGRKATWHCNDFSGTRKNKKPSPALAGYVCCICVAVRHDGSGQSARRATASRIRAVRSVLGSLP